MKILKIISVFLLIFSSMEALKFEERKAKLAKILQTEVGYHSSHSHDHYRHGHHGHYHHHHYHSGSVEKAGRKGFREGVYYGKTMTRRRQRFYLDYPCAYQPYYVIPYSNGPCRWRAKMWNKVLSENKV